MIHPTAVVDETRGPVSVGDGAVLGPRVVVYGPAIIGDGAHLHAGVIVGDSAEHLNAETDWEEPVLIGDRGVLRENVVVQRPTQGGMTVIERGCYVMHGCHIAHDCRVEEDCRLSPKVVLGGHSVVMRQANLGIAASLHQWAVVGPFAMVGMGAVVVHDVPPGVTVVGVPARSIGVNRRGLETPDEVLDPAGRPQSYSGQMRDWYDAWLSERTGALQIVRGRS